MKTMNGPLKTQCCHFKKKKKKKIPHTLKVRHVCCSARRQRHEIYNAAAPFSPPVSEYSCFYQDVPTHKAIEATRRLYYDVNRSNNPV